MNARQFEFALGDPQLVIQPLKLVLDQDGFFWCHGCRHVTLPGEVKGLLVCVECGSARIEFVEREMV